MIYKNLYIIGNGFDICHGIKSRFSDYREWLEKNDYDLYYKLTESYEGSIEQEWWYDFENNLADFDILNYAFRIGFENQPDFASDDFRERDRYVAQLKVENEFALFVEAIHDSLYKWLNTLPIPQADKTMGIEKNNSLFLTFNYTRTLEDAYKVPSEQILHIHGCIDQEDSIIFGHSADSKEIENRVKYSLPKIPNTEGLSEEEYYDLISEYEIEHSTQLAIDATQFGVCALQKNVSQILSDHKDYFQQLAEVEYVNVIGFSFSKVDVPYIMEVQNAVDLDLAKWTISYHNEDDHTRTEFLINNSKLANHRDRINLYKL